MQFSRTIPPKRTPTANLLKEPSPRAVLDCAFLRYTASAFPIYALIKSPASQHCFHSRNRLSKKSRRKRFVSSDISDELLGSFTVHTHLLHNLRGFSSEQQGLHLKRSTYIFSSPPHDDTPSIRNSFTSQTPQGSQRIIPTSPLIAMTKILFFSSRRRSCCRGRPFSHTGGQFSPHNRHRFPKE